MLSNQENSVISANFFYFRIAITFYSTCNGFYNIFKSKLFSFSI